MYYQNEKLNEIYRDTWPNLGWANRMTHEEMIEEAERREKLNAGFKQDDEGNWYRPTLEELSKNERIDLAINEMRYILWGGQDGREFGNSVGFIVDVLKSLKDD